MIKKYRKVFRSFITVVCLLLFFNSYAYQSTCRIGLGKINHVSYIESALVLSKIGWSISAIPEISKIRTDKSTALRFVEINGDNYGFLSSELKQDKDIILKSVKSSELPFKNIDKIPLDRNYVKKMIQASGSHFSLKNFPQTYKNDKSIILQVVKNNAWNINYVATKFLNDKDVAIATLTYAKHFYKKFGENIKNDLDIIHLVVGDAGMFATFPQVLKDNRSIALEAIKADSNNVNPIDINKKFFSDPLFIPYILDSCYNFSYRDLKALLTNRNNKLRAVMHCSILENLNASDRDDPEIILAALNNDPEYFNKIPNSLKHDIKFIKLSLTINGSIYQYLDTEYKTQRNLAILAVENKGENLQYLSDKYKNDKRIVLLAITNNPIALKYASNRLKDNKQVVTTAIKQNGYTLEYASKELKNNKEMLKHAIISQAGAIEYASERLKQDEELQLMVIKKDAIFINRVKVKNKKVIKKYIEKNIKAKKKVKIKILKEYFKDHKNYKKECFNVMLPMLWAQSDLINIKPKNNHRPK